MGAEVVVPYPFILLISTCPFEVMGSYHISIVDYLIPWIIRILPAVILDIIYLNGNLLIVSVLVCSLRWGSII
jgi:hypothetical protein